MAISINKVLIQGNLGHSPQMSGPACKLSVATTEVYKGEKKTTWHNVTVFGKSAENCMQYLEKGQQVLVDGKIDVSKWEDKEGNKRSKTEIIAFNVQFGPKKDQPTQERQEQAAEDLPF